MAKSQDPNYTALTGYISNDTYKRVKHMSINTGEPVDGIIQIALEIYLTSFRGSW